MPTRIIREGIISSPRINALSPGAELFYRRLMSVADDYGRYHASVVTLRGACWPTNPEKIREKDVAKWMDELLAGDDPLIKTYVFSGASYLEVQDFGQQTRTESKFPDPPWSNSDSNGLSDAKQMLSRCESNAKPSRSRNTKSKTKSDVQCLNGTPVEAPESEFERELESVAVAIAARHPQHRTCGKSQVRKKLKIIAQKTLRAERAQCIRRIDQIHQKWCDYWAKDPGSPFAKGLANWLAPTEGRFEDEPPALFDVATEAPPVRRML